MPECTQTIQVHVIVVFILPTRKLLKSFMEEIKSTDFSPPNEEKETTEKCEKVNGPNTMSNDSTSVNNDPYAYLDRSEFTSEKFKIEIRNLPKYYGYKELKKLLNSKLNLKPTKIKAPSRRGTWIYVCFKSEEDKASALLVLNGYEWKGNKLTADAAKPVPDPLVKKRMNDSNSSSNSSNKKTKLDERDLQERVKDASTPFWKIPYSNQLEAKECEIRKGLTNFGKELIKINPELLKWWKEQQLKYNGLPCELLPIRHADLIDGYRNKCEFSIGINEDTGQKTVGFRLGSYIQGSVSVAPVVGVPNVPEPMRIAAEVFQKFIQNSEYDVYNAELHQGYWRQLTVRYGFHTNEMMLIVGFDPQQLTETELCNLKNSITKYFKDMEESSCKIHSLFFQKIKKRKSQDDEQVFEHVFGETYITEKILGKIFRISPQAFFQVNTIAADVLYKSIGELAGLTEHVTLLDVCCGTGSIGISLSEKCGEVLGLEISEEAIADAKVNAEMNNIKNAEFYAGKAEEILHCVAYKAKHKDIVAIVDPPRAGLRQGAIVQIRKNERIKKLVFVACDYKKAVKNFLDLGRATSKIYKGEPFLPVKAVPVDLFPHTPHCELLIYFERQ